MVWLFAEKVHKNWGTVEFPTSYNRNSERNGNFLGEGLVFRPMTRTGKAGKKTSLVNKKLDLENVCFFSPLKDKV